MIDDIDDDVDIAAEVGVLYPEEFCELFTLLWDCERENMYSSYDIGLPLRKFPRGFLLRLVGDSYPCLPLKPVPGSNDLALKSKLDISCFQRLKASESGLLLDDIFKSLLAV